MTAVQTVTPVLLSLQIADQILGLTRNSPAAARARYLDQERTQTWPAGGATGRVPASFIFFVVTARALTHKASASTNRPVNV